MRARLVLSELVSRCYHRNSRSGLMLATGLVNRATDTVRNYLKNSQHPQPVCGRCHDLLNHNRAVSTVSPSIQSIKAYLDESPHKENRIYHVIDAADFPMSLIDGIYEALSIHKRRSKARRAATERYISGRKLSTISFVVTRSDLWGQLQGTVDSKMEYVESILREKLKTKQQKFRMGSVHLISAYRGWWTKKVKEEIREHGGGIWIVGKANAGKSSFVEACVPKDSHNLEKMSDLIAQRNKESAASRPQKESEVDSDSLLPPAPKEDLYPALPVVSSLPGTTVSPIRIPFGRGKGEIIDLPGLDRGNLADYMVDEHKRDLIMNKRKKPDRHTIKPEQSLLLGGGLVRITPTDPDMVLTAACFLPIKSHLTNTWKALEMQAQQRSYPGANMVREGTGPLISSAGTFDLKWDVTPSHLPTSIAKAVEDKRMKPPLLPYKVMSADILIEGCGWVELTVQVRTKPTANEDESARDFPQVEVFTPHGKHVASRPPIESYLNEAERAKFKRKKHGGLRRNVGHKKRIENSRK